MPKDKLTKAQRSWNMARIKGKNTTPELRVHSFLHNLGYRFRLHEKKLPGKPDVILPKYKPVIFIHGCFWHRHRGCKNCTTPTNRQEFWVTKLEGNAIRDKLNYQLELKEQRFSRRITNPRQRIFLLGPLIPPNLKI